MPCNFESLWLNLHILNFVNVRYSFGLEWLDVLNCRIVGLEVFKVSWITMLLVLPLVLLPNSIKVPPFSAFLYTSCKGFYLVDWNFHRCRYTRITRNCYSNQIILWDHANDKDLFACNREFYLTLLLILLAWKLFHVTYLSSGYRPFQIVIISNYN